MSLHPQIEYIKSLGWNIKIVPTHMMADIGHVKKTWKERWFSWPWNPLQDFKTVYQPMAMRMDDTWFVSYKTYAILEKELGVKYGDFNNLLDLRTNESLGKKHE